VTDPKPKTLEELKAEKEAAAAALDAAWEATRDVRDAADDAWHHAYHAYHDALEAQENLAANVVTCRKAYKVADEAHEAAEKKVPAPYRRGDMDLYGYWEVANVAKYRWVKSIEALRLVAPEGYNEEQAALAAVLRRTGDPAPCGWLDQD